MRFIERLEHAHGCWKTLSQYPQFTTYVRPLPGHLRFEVEFGEECRACHATVTYESRRMDDTYVHRGTVRESGLWVATYLHRLDLHEQGVLEYEEAGAAPTG